MRAWCVVGSHGGRGGGAVRAVQEDELLHHQGRPHPQGTVRACIYGLLIALALTRVCVLALPGGVPARLVQEQRESQPLRRQGE